MSSRWILAGVGAAAIAAAVWVMRHRAEARKGELEGEPKSTSTGAPADARGGRKGAPAGVPATARKPGSVTLRIINVTDVYKLDNFPSLRTLIKDKAAQLNAELAAAGGGAAGRTISILTGDFLAPYLLSSLDKGIGMMTMLNKTPIDYLIWGNHEDDLEHEHVCRRVAEYRGTWLNTNMQDHAMMAHQKPFDIITLKGGAAAAPHTRTVGLLGVISDSPSLYRPSAFGGATIADPYDTLCEYQDKLEREHGVDLVLPLSHTYVPQDKIICKRMNVPVLLSGHDHHVVDEVFAGTRLLKAGGDANHAIVLDITWDSADASCRPTIEAEVVDVPDWAPDAALAAEVRKAYSVLDHLKHTQLSSVPDEYRPLSSAGSRSRPCTIASFLFTAVREALNSDDHLCRDAGAVSVDAVIVSGGNIRGGKTYPPQAFFSMEDLKSEIQEALEVVIVRVPGSVLEVAVPASQGSSNPGFLQYDAGVKQAPPGADGRPGKVTQIGGRALQRDRVYRIATTLWDVADGTGGPLIEYFKAHADELPAADAGHPVQSLLLSYFAANVWQQLLARLDKDHDGTVTTAEMLEGLDANKDGVITRDEVGAAMAKLGMSVDAAEHGFVRELLALAGDADGDGTLTPAELDADAAASKRVVTPKV